MEFTDIRRLQDRIRATGVQGEFHVLQASKRVNPDVFYATLKTILPGDKIGLTARSNSIEITIADSVTDEQIDVIENALESHNPDAPEPDPNFEGMTLNQLTDWLESNVSDPKVRLFLKYLAQERRAR